MAMGQDTLEVIGGSANGGIIVREGKALDSKKDLDRLSTGAVVRALETDLQTGRLRYELVCGTGPATGWVSTKIQGKEMLVRQGQEGDDAQSVLKLYSQRMQDSREVGSRECPGFNRKAFPWRHEIAGMQQKLPTEQVKAELERDMGAKAGMLVQVKAPDAAGAERRVDPADGQTRTFDELRARYHGRCSGPQLWEYWGGACKRVDDVTVQSEGPTMFGYAGNFEKSPPFALFDVRDEVCVRVGGFKHGQIVRDNCGHEFAVIGAKVDRISCETRLWFQPCNLGRPGAGTFPGTAATLKAKLAVVTPERRKTQDFATLVEASIEKFDSMEDIDGESVVLCRQCHVPVGELAYAGDNGGLVHGECMAQYMLQDLKQQEEEHQEKEAAQKRARRVEYDIGWKIQRVPKNLGPLGKLGVKDIKGGACCLVLHDATHSVGLAPTIDPAAAINLEYLSLALKVRVQEGREPLFSLDPLDPSKMDSMQKKVFEPAWLAGTSIGEVMFQADYHLKELSMGEYAQPVLGMKSCFDYSDEEGHNQEWSAREWFVVRKAEIHMSEDDVLVPFVKMGVEAREQVLKNNVLEDAPITRGNHPLVKYAEAFTHNFDLIAERKSVIYHLRELAKASILAKYIVESGMRLDSSWFSLFDDVKDPGFLEIPQLWNERYHSTVEVQNGKIDETGSHTMVRNVYGGVDFGLDRFSVSAPRVGAMGALAARMGPRAAARVGPAGAAPQLSFGRSVTHALSGVAGVSGALRAATGPAGVAGSLRAVTGPSSLLGGPRAGAAFPRVGGFAPRLSGFAASQLTAPQGVDLNLDKFNLSSHAKVSQQAIAGGWMGAGDDLAVISKAFWSSLQDGASNLFTAEDKHLLKEVFNPNLSDRAEEGDQFVPPDTSAAYVQRLRNLVKEETVIRQRRKDLFHDRAFVMGDAGALFPSSWTSSYEIARGRTPKKALAGPAAGGDLHPRPEYIAEAHLFDHIVASVTPIFDMLTEDGMRCRIYRQGSLEVRTHQEHEGKETVGSVFSIRAVARGQVGQKKAEDHELIVKATEYIQRTGAHNQSYVVVETDKGSVIVTEMACDGTTSWEENLEEFEDRNSLAKVVRTAECKDKGVSVREFREFQAKGGLRPGLVAGKGEGKLYAQRAFSRAVGLTHRITTGFRQPVPSIVCRRWTPTDAARASRLEQERRAVDERTKASLAARKAFAPEERKAEAKPEETVVAEEAASTEDAASTEEAASTAEASSTEEVASTTSEETSD